MVRKKLSNAYLRFTKMEAAGGIMLILSAFLAIIIANSGAHHLYEAFLHLHPFAWISGVDTVGLNLSLHHFINDGAMVVFFFLVGLELKREIVEGELNSLKTAMLPIIGAVGGMFLPALIYSLLNWDDPVAIRGWATPTATDIAFAIGVLALLGSRIPIGLKVFLSSLAIFDDLGAVLIIALFYTAELSILPLIAVAVCSLALFAFNRLGVISKIPYLGIGVIMWFAMLQSGVHATIAGVLLALFIPLKSKADPEVSPLKELEHNLESVVAFFILPLFAFANAGLNLHGMGMSQLLHTVPLGIALGLFFGKQVGVISLCLLALKMKIARMPNGVTKGHLYGASLLCGIGFTMSLFVSGLAFAGDVGFDPRLGIILGSFASGLGGYIVLRFFVKPAAVVAK